MHLNLWKQQSEKKILMIAITMVFLQILALPFAPWPWWIQVIGGMGVVLLFTIIMGICFLPLRLIAVLFLFLALGGGISTSILIYLYPISDVFPDTLSTAHQFGILAILIVILISLALAGGIGWRRKIIEKRCQGPC